MSNVLPFRRRPPPEEPPEKEEPSRCPECGWKLPIDLRADPDSVRRECTLYFDCPECGASLFWSIRFDDVED